jgi:hypothetical protein
MLSAKDKAVPLFPVAKATASTNNRQKRNYRNPSEKSSPKPLKKLAGEVAGILFYLQSPLSQHQRQKTWHIFELKLRQYLDLKYCGVGL